MSTPALQYTARLSRELFTLRTPPEVRERLVNEIVQLGGASWAAVYIREGEEYVLTSLGRTREPSHSLPARISGAALDHFSDGSPTLRRLSASSPAAVPPAAAVGCVITPEHDNSPSLLLIGPPKEGGWDEQQMSDLQLLVDLCADALRNAEFIERLRAQVFVDFVTGCYNRRAFDEHLSVELVRAHRYARSVTLLLIDLDDFKAVNDTLGHPTGDYALKRVGEALRSAFRTTDRVCRYGGDEFAIIFPETPKQDVLRLAERLRRQLAEIFPDDGNAVRLTASMGLAGYPLDAGTAEDLVLHADRALYRAKSRGRNQVVSA